MSKKAVPLKSAPPPVIYWSQASKDLPELKAKKERIEQKLTCWKRMVEHSEQELADITRTIMKKEAHMDAAIAAIERSEGSSSASRPSHPEHPVPKPSKSRKLG